MNNNNFAFLDPRDRKRSCLNESSFYRCRYLCHRSPSPHTLELRCPRRWQAPLLSERTNCSQRFSFLFIVQGSPVSFPGVKFFARFVVDQKIRIVTFLLLGKFCLKSDRVLQLLDGTSLKVISVCSWSMSVLCMPLPDAKKMPKIKLLTCVTQNFASWVRMSFFRPSATVSRIGLLESRLRRPCHCHWCGGPPPKVVCDKASSLMESCVCYHGGPPLLAGWPPSWRMVGALGLYFD